MIRWAKITARFEGFHHYPAAPVGVRFLANLHRHEFHVTVFLEQFHNDRDVEYILLKRWVQHYCNDYSLLMPETSSCEDIAENLARELRQKYENRRVMVEVTEDGENGALIEL